MHVKSIVTAAVLIFADASDGEELVKIHSEKLDVTTFVTEIKSSATSSVTVLKEGVDSYWLVEGPEVASATPITLRDECLQNSNSFEHFQLVNSELVLFSPTHTLIYDTVNDEVTSCTALARPLASPFNYWSPKHQTRISGARIVEVTGEPQDSAESNAHPHAAQTALAISCDQNQYVTAGFHDQSLKLWSLKHSELLSENTLGRWYSSRKITDAAFLGDQLFVASSKGKIEARSPTTGEVLWHTKPCRSFPHFLPEGNRSASSQHLFYRCSDEPEFGYIHRVSVSWKSVALDVEGQSSVPDNAVKLGDDLTAFSFRDGTIELFSLKTAQRLQTLLPSSADRNPRLMAYNTDQKKLYVVSDGTQLEIFGAK